ncbi:type VII secretion target [Nocardia sp. NPDC059240]|uniref:type VII secretion target n=1 Tax=Nocardia sp. NPDC059240 TaxID=3346786 RepID=UPI00368E7919
MKVTPQSLIDAAAQLGRAGEDIDDTERVPHLGAARGVAGSAGSAIAAALGSADAASTQAKQAVHLRYDAMATLLFNAAKTYHDSDVELADAIHGLGDLNSAQ